MSKPIFWISLKTWMLMTPGAHELLDTWLEQSGQELGIDVDGWHTDEIRRQADFQKDYDESRETAGGPGA